MQDTIFFIDDYPDYLEMLVRFLRVKGYSNLHCFTDPEMAIKAIKGGLVPAAVVSDCEMPVLTGPEVLEIITDLDPSIYGILMTGNPRFTQAPDHHFPVIMKDDIDRFTNSLDQALKVVLCVH